METASADTLTPAVIAVSSKHILARIPLDNLRLISGNLLAITAAIAELAAKNTALTTIMAHERHHLR